MSKAILEKEFELLKQDLIAEYDRLNMRASGQFAEELEVKTTETNAKLYGMNYAVQLEYGRKPSNKYPPIVAIRQWIIDKGIVNNIQGKISISSLAFLIARKIKNEGWKRERFGGVELISKVITEERMQEIIDKIGANHINAFIERLGKELNKILA